MLSNAYFLAKFRFDTAENEPAKKLQNFAKFANFSYLNPYRNASPNVVDLLLDNRSAEKNADMRKERRGKGRTPNPKTPVKMAPVVSSETL